MMPQRQKKDVIIAVNDIVTAHVKTSIVNVILVKNYIETFTVQLISAEHNFITVKMTP